MEAILAQMRLSSDWAKSRQVGRRRLGFGCTTCETLQVLEPPASSSPKGEYHQKTVNILHPSQKEPNPKKGLSSLAIAPIAVEETENRHLFAAQRHNLLHEH